MFFASLQITIQEIIRTLAGEDSVHRRPLPLAWEGCSTSRQDASYGGVIGKTWDPRGGGSIQGTRSIRAVEDTYGHATEAAGAGGCRYNGMVREVWRQGESALFYVSLWNYTLVSYLLINTVLACLLYDLQGRRRRSAAVAVGAEGEIVDHPRAGGGRYI